MLSETTQAQSILEYFMAHPKKDIPHAEVVDWAVANNKTTADVDAMTFATPLTPTANEKSNLLGTGTSGAVTESDAVDALEIASIEYDTTNGWVIKSKGVDGQGNAEDGDALANGHIAIFGTGSLANPFRPVEEAAIGEVYHFFKAVLVK